MDIIRKFINGINKIAFVFSMFLFFIMALSITYGVIARYVFNSPSIWVTEVSGYFLVGTSLLSAGYTLRKGGHIRIDSLDQVLPKTIRRIFYFLSHTVILIFALILTWEGILMAYNSYISNWKASTMLNTPLYIPQLFIPLGSSFLFLQTLLLMIDFKKYENSESQSEVEIEELLKDN